MRTYIDYKNQVSEIKTKVETDKCFHTKTAKKDALETLNRAYENLVKENKDYHLGKSKGFNYWDVPSNLHQVKAKHVDIFQAFGINAQLVLLLAMDRVHLKSFDVVKKVAEKKEYKPTEKQATHLGTCQICGSVHKVNRDTGKLASHGYTKGYSFHMGECMGSRKDPYEISNAYLIDYSLLLDERCREISKQILASESTTVFNVRKLREEYDEIVNHVQPRIKKRWQTWKQSQLKPIYEPVDIAGWNVPKPS